MTFTVSGGRDVKPSHSHWSQAVVESEQDNLLAGECLAVEYALAEYANGRLTSLADWLAADWRREKLSSLPEIPMHMRRISYNHELLVTGHIITKQLERELTKVSTEQNEEISVFNIRSEMQVQL